MTQHTGSCARVDIVDDCHTKQVLGKGSLESTRTAQAVHVPAFAYYDSTMYKIEIFPILVRELSLNMLL